MYYPFFFSLRHCFSKRYSRSPSFMQSFSLSGGGVLCLLESTLEDKVGIQFFLRNVSARSGKPCSFMHWACLFAGSSTSSKAPLMQPDRVVASPPPSSRDVERLILTRQPDERPVVPPGSLRQRLWQRTQGRIMYSCMKAFKKLASHKSSVFCSWEMRPLFSVVEEWQDEVKTGIYVSKSFEAATQ